MEKHVLAVMVSYKEAIVVILIEKLEGTYDFDLLWVDWLDWLLHHAGAETWNIIHPYKRVLFVLESLLSNHLRVVPLGWMRLVGVKCELGSHGGSCSHWLVLLGLIRLNRS
jgi:hypothetical protein